MKIALASDHAGYELKEKIKEYITSKGHDVVDYGTHSGDTRVDYPDFGFAAASAVSCENAERAVLVCGTGIGMSITANKVRNVRAALCHDHFTAVMSRRHNDSNVLVVGARVIGYDVAIDIVDAWLKEKFEGGRHSGRLEKIHSFERENYSGV
ncbi:MAG: ribose 5-phosphate isomerase B [Synergistes sp.]|nr:ribose 5-phosphate isomerase B [Synergistes sp.]